MPISDSIKQISEDVFINAKSETEALQIMFPQLTTLIEHWQQLCNDIEQRDDCEDFLYKIFYLLRMTRFFLTRTNITDAVKEQTIETMADPENSNYIPFELQYKYLRQYIQAPEDNQVIALIGQINAIEHPLLKHRANIILQGIDGHSQQQDLAAKTRAILNNTDLDCLEKHRELTNLDLPKIIKIEVFDINKNTAQAQALYRIIQRYTEETKFSRANTFNGPRRFEVDGVFYELSHSIHRAEDGRLYVQRPDAFIGKGSNGDVFLLEDEIILNTEEQNAHWKKLENTEEKRVLKRQKRIPSDECVRLEHATHTLITDSSIQFRSTSTQRTKSRIIMPYLIGPDLAPFGPFLEYGPEKLKAIKDLILELNEIHEKGFIHRDIKSKNIRRAADDHWKIIDRDSASEQSMVRKSVSGTFVYAHPHEIMVKPNLCPSHDRFSMGLVFFEILRGKTIYTENQEVIYPTCAKGHRGIDFRLFKSQLKNLNCNPLFLSNLYKAKYQYQEITFENRLIPFSDKTKTILKGYVESYITHCDLKTVDEMITELDRMITAAEKTKTLLKNISASITAFLKKVPNGFHSQYEDNFHRLTQYLANLIDSDFYDNEPNQKILTQFINALADYLENAKSYTQVNGLISSINQQLDANQTNPDLQKILEDVASEASNYLPVLYLYKQGEGALANLCNVALGNSIENNATIRPENLARSIVKINQQTQLTEKEKTTCFHRMKNDLSENPGRYYLTRTDFIYNINGPENNDNGFIELRKQKNYFSGETEKYQSIEALEDNLITNYLQAENHLETAKFNIAASNTAKYLEAAKDEENIEKQSEYYFNACLEQNLPQKIISGIFKLINIIAGAAAGFVTGGIAGTLIPVPIAGTITGAVCGGVAGIATSVAVMKSPAYCQGLGFFRSPETETEEKMVALVKAIKGPGVAPAA